MPYIKQKDRDKYIDFLNKVPIPNNPGELNYLITMLCALYKDCNAPINYSKYNEIIGVLECAKLEFYRRKVTEYEKIKIEENGDV